MLDDVAGLDVFDWFADPWLVLDDAVCPVVVVLIPSMFSPFSFLRPAF
jgi:hypothetical protein